MDFKFNFQNQSITYGLTDELIAFYVTELFKTINKNIILLTSNLYESNKLFNYIKVHNDNFRCMILFLLNYLQLLQNLN